MRVNNTYSAEFKKEAVRMVNEKGIATHQAARLLNISNTLLRMWVLKDAAARAGWTQPGTIEPPERYQETSFSALSLLQAENVKLREELKNLRGLVDAFTKKVSERGRA